MRGHAVVPAEFGGHSTPDLCLSFVDFATKKQRGAQGDVYPAVAGI